MAFYKLENWAESTLAAGITEAQIVADHPELSVSDIRACLAYAADREQAPIFPPTPI